MPLGVRLYNRTCTMYEKTFAVYIMTNCHRTVLYTGVTSDLETRVAEHRAKVDPGSFTARYNVRVLVYYEATRDARAAIGREKQIKGWKREKKIRLIESVNPEWKELAPLPVSS